MKPLHFLLISSVMLSAINTFSQGKVSWYNNAERLYVLGNALPGDSGGGGISGTNGALTSSPLPSGIDLVAALYAGSDAASLTLQTSVRMSSPYSQFSPAVPGVWTPEHAILNGVLGGALAYFQIYIYDSAFAGPMEALNAGSYFGTSGLFTAVPGSSINYPALCNTNPPVYSTWPPQNVVINTAGFIPPPSVLQPTPASQTAISGDTVNFHSSFVFAYPPYSFQWYFGANPIDNATNSILTLTNVQTIQSGEYSLRVTSRGVSSNSPPATLSVVPGLKADLVPLLTVKGDVGSQYSVEYINAIGPTNAWMPLATLTITNSPQTYVDMSAVGQPLRFYRVALLP